MGWEFKISQTREWPSILKFLLDTIHQEQCIDDRMSAQKSPHPCSRSPLQLCFPSSARPIWQGIKEVLFAPTSIEQESSIWICLPLQETVELSETVTIRSSTRWILRWPSITHHWENELETTELVFNAMSTWHWSSIWSKYVKMRLTYSCIHLPWVSYATLFFGPHAPNSTKPSPKQHPISFQFWTVF